MKGARKEGIKEQKEASKEARKEAQKEARKKARKEEEKKTRKDFKGFVGFTEAFDSIKHNILFDKLDQHGIRGIGLDLIRSYPYNRIQLVLFNNAESS